MANVHANPVVPFDNIAQVTAAILAHPALIMLPGAAVERIERIAERGGAHMRQREVVLLRQVIQIVRAISWAAQSLDLELLQVWFSQNNRAVISNRSSIPVKMDGIYALGGGSTSSPTKY
jgi:hypothetical protein